MASLCSLRNVIDIDNMQDGEFRCQIIVEKYKNIMTFYCFNIYRYLKSFILFILFLFFFLL